jgi:hypothetical protein
MSTINHFGRQSNSPVYDRVSEHNSDAMRLLERLRQAARDHELPSTADLQREGVFGLRPVNRIGDLIKGKHNHTRYDIEKIRCGRGQYRWRLHEPNRPGYPKHKNQTVLLLDLPAPSPNAIPDSSDWYERLHGPRSSAPQPDLGPLFAGVGR